MRIAVFIKRTHFHKNSGGLETQNKMLCEGLAERGNEIVVFSPRYELPENTRTENNVEYHFVTSTYKYFLSKINKNSWYNKSLIEFKKINSERKFDLVISQSSAGISIIEAKADLNIKIISISHGSIIGELNTVITNTKSLRDFGRLIWHTQYAIRQFFWRQRQFILNSDKVIAVSSAVKKQLEDETFPSDNLIIVINNGVTPFETGTFPEHNTKHIIYCGNISRDKGAELLLALVCDPRFGGFTLTLIGDGDYLQKFSEVKNSGKATMTINILGRITHAEALRVFKDSVGSVFLMPTRRIEGFPMVIVEALMAGLPIVAYDIGGNRDAILDGKSGYLIPFENAKLFVEKVFALSTDLDLKKSMSVFAKDFALKNLTTSIMVDRYLAVIMEVLKK